jgi:hypothetical protein
MSTVSSFKLDQACEGWTSFRFYLALYEQALSLRASPAVLSMWPNKKKSDIHHVIYLFATTPIKLKLRLQIGGRLVIANHLDQSLWLANQKQGAGIKSYLFNSSLGDAQLCCAFYQPQKTVQNARPKPFCWAKPAYIEHRWGCSKA